MQFSEVLTNSRFSRNIKIENDLKYADKCCILIRIGTFIHINVDMNPLWRVNVKREKVCECVCVCIIVPLHMSSIA